MHAGIALPVADRTGAVRAAAPRRSVLWIGGAAVLELGIARAALAPLADVIDVATPREAADLAGGGLARQPVFAVLAADRPGRFTLADAVAVSRAWPLVPLVSVASSLVDGRRRSGPALPGVEEVPWHDLGARGRWWLAALAAGLPTPLGTPATARREERVVDAVIGCRRAGLRGPANVPAVAVAADGDEAVEGLAALPRWTALATIFAARRAGGAR